MELTQFSRGHALIVGVGADLPDTVSDATGLADILKDSQRCAYPPEQVTLLTGQAADRSSILAGLDKLAQVADEGSTAIVYFSGHGYKITASIGEAYYLMPFGYDVNRLKETAINGTELVNKLRYVRAQKLLLLLDCCHSGGMSDLKAPGLEFAKEPLPPEAQSLLAEGSGRVVIASSKADEYSYAGKPYSAFAQALIEALCGADTSQKDGYVRVSDLALYTHKMVSQRSKNRQNPILHFERADNFVLAYYAGGDKQPKALPFSQEPEVELEPEAQHRSTGRSVFNQTNQTVHGKQINIAGDVHGNIQ